MLPSNQLVPIIMYGVNAKLPKTNFTCFMCRTTKVQDVYIWGNFVILPKHLYKEQRICKKCAKREIGKRTKLEDVIDERTKQWLKRK